MIGLHFGFQSIAPFLASRIPLVPMYTSTFIFAKRQFDDEFHRLDEIIANAARSMPGFLGEESWENPASGLVSNVYYRASLEALQRLIEHPAHVEAKARQANWLAGYRVVIAQVVRTYGNAQLDGVPPTP